jgi:branched-chain amino acid transport system substrate-binding protein
VDAILCFHNVPESIALVQQMKENNFNVKYFQGIKGTWPIEFYKALGKDAEFVLCDGFWTMDYPYKGAKELGEAYVKDHGRRALGIGLYYAVAQILWAAIEKAGTLDSLKVRQAVLNNEFYTVMGKVKYDNRGIATFLLADFQWRNGKRELNDPRQSRGHIPVSPSKGLFMSPLKGAFPRAAC